MRCPDCGREVKDDAAVCRACGFAFDPALLDAPNTRPLKKAKSGFTNQHSSVRMPPAPASAEGFDDSARTDSTEGPARKGSSKSADEPVDVFATSPGDAPLFSDLSSKDDATRPVVFAADRTIRAPAPDLSDLVDATVEHAATVVHDMASALAAAGLRPGPNADSQDAADAPDADDAQEHAGGHQGFEDDEPTAISPPPSPSSRNKRR